MAAAVVLAVVGSATGLAAATATGWRSGHADADGPGRPVQDPVAADGWEAVLDRLDAARADAFSRADPARLAGVHAPGSAGLAADVALLAPLRQAGRSAHGLRRSVTAVTAQRVTDEKAVLRVRDVLGAHEVRDASGRVVHREPARGEREFEVRLVRTPAGWRITSVTALG